MRVKVLLTLMFMKIAYATNNQCKKMNFKTLLEGKALVNHVFKSESVSNEGQCKIKCYVDDRCISYNFGVSAISDEQTCELSESDHVVHPADIVDRPNTFYRGAENTCKCVDPKVCRVNFADDTHQCQCRNAGFTGANCDQAVDIDECGSSPCMNGGSCQDQANGYTCTCLAGFTGQICQTDTDECGSSPCMNGGSCQDQANGYTCTCLAGFTGQNCQTAASGPCDSSPCFNGGTCQAQGASYTCTCPDQMSGTNCQTKACPSDWTSSQGNCYGFFQSYLPWHDAETHCVNEGGHLVSIHNDAENTAVAGAVSMEAWIGLSDPETEGTYKWADGTPLDYTSFGSPLASGKGCIYMEPSTRKWKKIGCANGYKPFVCSY